MLLVYLCEVCHQRVRGGAGGVQRLLLLLPLPPLVFGRSSVFVGSSEPLTALSLPPARGVQEVRTVLLEEEESNTNNKLLHKFLRRQEAQKETGRCHEAHASSSTSCFVSNMKQIKTLGNQMF